MIKPSITYPQRGWLLMTLIQGFQIIATLFFVVAALGQPNTNTIDLSGDWRFAIDRKDEGEGARWFARELPERLRLPGSMQEQEFGDPVGPDTPWVGSGKGDWLNDPRYAPYTTRENFKYPWNPSADDSRR